jgi:PAS domain S-box-containing protein
MDILNTRRGRMPSIYRELPFSYLMMGILFVIIATVVLAGIWTSYETSRTHLEDEAAGLRAMTESHINTSFRMIDASLKLYDSTYNEEMKDAFVVVMAEYDRTGRDPSRMDLEGLKDRVGGMDIYVIDDRSVVEYTTKPSDLGLDFTVIYPDFVEYLDSIRNTPGFYPDRVVKDWTTRRMTKYSYMPTPDHRYVIELGLASEVFEEERMGLDYFEIVDEVRSFNPYLEDVLLFQTQKRLIHNSSYVPTPEESAMLDYLLRQNRTTQVVEDPASERTVVWEVVDLRDPDYGSDMSLFVKLTYNDALLAREQNELAFVNAFSALLVLMTGGLLAASVARRVSRPMEQIAADIDAIAAGDLDHAIRPVGGAELSRLADKTGVMVDRLKEQIRRREASEQRFTDLVQLLPLGVFETDLDGDVTFANPAALEALGLGADDLRRGLTIFAAIAPRDRERATASFAAVLRGERAGESEFTGLRSDGSTFSMLTSIAARCENGAVAGVRGSIVDITRLKQVEEEVRRMNAELEERVAQRTHELQAFTYSVSHDLRAPLRAIDGYSSILSQTAAPRLEAREQHYLAEVRATVRQMNALVDGLLALSRLDRQEPVRERVAPAPLVLEVVGVVLEQDPDRTVTVTVGDLPPCCADRAMLRQVYANLIGNAVKFTRDAAEPAIEVGAVTAGAETEYYVRDNGVGFEMAEAERIFEPFRRLHRADRFEGFGIGLATVDRIVRRHGGRVRAESAPGEGATFFFTLPSGPSPRTPGA